MDLIKDKIDATVIFPVRGEGGKRKVLLVEKLEKIGVGCKNGFGGSIEERETPRACAARELREESGLVTLEKELEFVGVMTFHNQRKDGSHFVVRVFVFIASKCRGKLKLEKNKVANPKWYKTYRLPLKKLMPADPFWVPLILSGKKIKGNARYGPNQKTLLRIPEVKVVKYLGDVD